MKGTFDPKRALPVPAPPPVPRGASLPKGTRNLLLELGPEKFAEWIRSEKRLLITDTTMRDAHQSLLATRVRTYDMLAVADAVARLTPNLFSLEMWGGATFDTSMRFLQEDPWQRLAELRQRVPNILFQMLLRASNAVGYTTYPDNVVRAFVKRSAEVGIDVFRIFDSLNSTANMQLAIESVRTDTNVIAEAAICYTGDILDPTRTKYSLKYYVALAKELVNMGTHILGIKDMAGLCKPYAAYALVKALREEVGVPIHFHTHDTSGINSGSVLRACDAGVDIADAALASMGSMTSQPCLNGIVAALEHTERDTQIDRVALDDLSRYWAVVRELYYPFEEGLKAPGADVYQHEMPGGQYTNLRQQSKSLGLESRWQEVCEAYATANQLVGDIVKVTPSSKVVGDLALFLVTNKLTAADVMNSSVPLSFPRSVVEMMQGLLGEPEGGWPKAFQEIVLKSAHVSPIVGRPGCVDGACRLRGGRAGDPLEDRTAIRRKTTCCRTCSTRRCTSTSRSTSRSSATRRRFRRRTSSTGCSLAKRPRWNRTRQDAHREVPHDRRSAGGRHAHGVLRAERPAARGDDHQSIGIGDREAQPEGRSGQPGAHRRTDAGQGLVSGRPHGPDGEEGRATPLHRSDEDGNGRLQPARCEGRHDSRRCRRRRRSARSPAGAAGLRRPSATLPTWTPSLLPRLRDAWLSSTTTPR
ncbi:MAG: hypothetical protein QM736_24185 [Vicinamibacterales bacterium]